MSADAAPQDRHSAMLAELAAMSLALARDLQNRALEAESVEDATRLAAAFQRVSRGLRQTLALELKVIRDADQRLREVEEAAADELAMRELKVEMRAEATAQRSEAVRRRIDDAFWSEHESPDWLEFKDAPKLSPRPPAADPIWRKLDTFLDAAEAGDDFLTRDFDVLVIEACDAIGVDPTLLYEIHDRQEHDRREAAADTS